MIIQEDEHSVAIPDALPIGNGAHLLVVPKEHSYSFVGLERGSCSTGDHLASFTQSLGQKYFPAGFITFEHGSFKPGSNNMSVYHSHAHIVGTERDIIDELEQRIRNSGLHPHEISLTDNNYPHRLKNYINGHSYMFVQQGRRGLYVDEGEETIVLPSQFGQKNVHDITRIDRNHFWDWKYLVRHQCPKTMRVAVTRAADIVNRFKEN
jgi:diadenosine tetraphosphate (Ap4A) HIT family hydrolase